MTVGAFGPAAASSVEERLGRGARAYRRAGLYEIVGPKSAHGVRDSHAAESDLELPRDEGVDIGPSRRGRAGGGGDGVWSPRRWPPERGLAHLGIYALRGRTYRRVVGWVWTGVADEHQVRGQAVHGHPVGVR